MGNRKWVWVLPALMMVAVVVRADGPAGEIREGMTPQPEQSSPSEQNVLPVYTLQQLEQLQAETVLLEAQAAKAKAKAALTETSNKTGEGLVMGTAPQRLTYVQEIYGAGARLKARILLPTGRAVELLSGDLIPGTDLKIIAITPRSVRVAGMNGVSEHALPFH